MGFGQKASSVVLVSAGFFMSAEVVVSSVGDFLREFTCKNCSEATCHVAVVHCHSCTTAFLLAEPVQDLSIVFLCGYEGRVVFSKWFIFMYGVEGFCWLLLNRRLRFL